MINADNLIAYLRSAVTVMLICVAVYFFGGPLATFAAKFIN